MTPEEMDEVMGEIYRDLEREAYDAVAGADLGPQRDDADEREHRDAREPFIADLPAGPREEGFLP